MSVCHDVASSLSSLELLQASLRPWAVEVGVGSLIEDKLPAASRPGRQRLRNGEQIELAMAWFGRAPVIYRRDREYCEPQELDIRPSAGNTLEVQAHT